MRGRSVRFDTVTATAGLAGTVGAILLPWAGYGSTGMALHRFPGWGWYLCAAVVLHAYTGWVLVARARGHGVAVTGRTRAVGLLLCAGTLAAAVVLTTRYDDAGAFYGPIVPAVRPVLGVGGPLAVLGILATAAAIRYATRTRRG